MARRSKRVDDPEMAGVPVDYEDLRATKWGLDWTEVLLIRERLALTPAERLEAAQTTINAALRIRAQNGERSPHSARS